MYKDPRVIKLAHTLVHHSTNTQPGDVIIIYADFKAKPLVIALHDEIVASGGYPFVEWSDTDITRRNYLGYPDEAWNLKIKWLEQQLKDIDGFISIRSFESDYVFADVPQDKVGKYRKFLKPLQPTRLSKKWVGLNYPTEGFAQKMKMSWDEYFDYMFAVMNVDYDAMGEAMQPLKKLMDKTDKVRIVGPGTDLSFSIKGINVIPCYGQNNIPDGEVYTAPVKDSVNGTIQYNTPSKYNGHVFDNVRLTFKDGMIVDASADGDNEALQGILDTDEGSRYVGEFAIGVNPMIKQPMTDILFDEKIAGSIHFTPGMSYEAAPNGNDSAVHWDLVLIQTPEYGGGEIYFDDVLIRKDGLFVVDELLALNPENLK